MIKLLLFEDIEVFAIYLVPCISHTKRPISEIKVVILHYKLQLNVLC